MCICMCVFLFLKKKEDEHTIVVTILKAKIDGEECGCLLGACLWNFDTGSHC